MLSWKWYDTSKAKGLAGVVILLNLFDIFQVPAWKKHTQLRVFLCVDSEKDDTLKKERKLDQLLRQLRILGRIKIVTWEHVKDEFKLSADSATESEAQGAAVAGISKPCPTHVADEFLHGVNELVKNQSSASVVTFLYLPRPPRDVQLSSLPAAVRNDYGRFTSDSFSAWSSSCDINNLVVMDTHGY